MATIKGLKINELSSILKRFTLEGKKALVTGASGGIGQTTAAAIAELGADVALVDLRINKAQENADYIAKKFGVKAIALQADVSDKNSVTEMVERIVSEFGALDVVHSNAGIIEATDSADMPIESWKRTIDINYTGTFLVNRAVCSWMRDNKREGAVVNTASMSGHIQNRKHGDERYDVAYNSSKAAVVSLTKGMAAEYIKYGIRVNSVSPGYMYSGLHDNMDQRFLDVLTEDVPMGRFGTMDEIGGAVVFLMSDLATYITGSDLLIDGGYTIW